jgi:hypothetical protein
MSKLRELLDQLETADYWTPNTFNRSSGVHCQIIDEFLATAVSAISFCVGDYRDFDGMAIEKSLCRLPFPACWFEVACGEPVATWGVLVDSSDGHVVWPFTLYFFERVRGSWTFRGVYAQDQFPFGRRTVPPGLWIGDAWSAKESYFFDQIMYVVCAFLTALNCPNVSRVEHKPDAKLQKARAKKGKKPLFSYWTLHLKTKSASGVELGGTHASPRVHLRRGHPRQYQPGKWTWVQPCMVGNPKMGMVHKDYDGSALAH